MSNNIAVLLGYHDTSESDEEFQPKQKERRSENRSWIKVSDFSSAKEAEAAVQL